jgi:NADH:ubiquinone oxidoreductase subunit 6 (subunit J)
MSHSYYSTEEISRPWYSKKRVWSAVAVVLLIVIVVPVAVTVTKEKQKENRYPDYTKLNYTLLETCKPSLSSPSSGPN